MKYLVTYNIAREFARTRSFKTEALAMAFIDATAHQCYRDNETFEHEIKMFEDDKTPAQLNAQIAQRLTEATPYNDGAPVFAKVDRSFYRVQLKNVATMAAKIKSAHRTFPAGAYKRMGSGRDYPVFYPGMTTKEYIVKFQSLNSNGYSYTKTGLAHVLPIDFDRLGDRPAALYENGALDFDVIEEPNEDYFSDAAAQDVAEVVAQALATIAITEAMADTSEDARELATCEAGESEASAPTAGRTSWAPVPQYVLPSLSQVKPGEPVPPAYRGGVDDIDPPSDGNAEPTTRPVESTDFSGDIPLSLAVSAFGGVSMSPERRGASSKSEYGQSMAADYETLHAQAVKGGTLDLLPEVFARYRSRQAGSYKAYLSSSSRCVSSFIAGPANFPAARMNKRADIAHKRLNEYLDGGKMALQAAIRTLRPDLRAIMSGDADAIDRLTVKIEAAERAQAQMKAANKAIRANAKQGEAHQIAALMELGYRESDATELVKPSQHWRSVGFASYSLTNNNANIRRMKERLEQISKAQAQEVQAVECANGVTLEDDAPANRVRLFFPGKPSEAIRTELKSSGFRWAPSVGAWQAYRNHGTLATAKRMAGEPVKAEENAHDAAPEAEIVAEVEIVAPSPVMESAEAPMAPVAEVLTEARAAEIYQNGIENAKISTIRGYLREKEKAYNEEELTIYFSGWDSENSRSVACLMRMKENIKSEASIPLSAESTDSSTPTVAVSTEAPTPAPAEFLTGSPCAFSRVIFCSPVALYGKTKWTLCVYKHDQYGACTGYSWFDDSAGFWRIDTRHPRYDGNDTHNGLPRSLAKLYAAHQSEVKAALSAYRTPTPPAVESQPEAVAPAVEAAQDVPADNANEWGPAIGETYIGAVEYAVQEANKRGDGMEYRVGNDATIERRTLQASEVTHASESGAWTGEHCKHLLKAQGRPEMKGKSGKWCAWLRIHARGVFSLWFATSNDLTFTHYATARERMEALQAMARAADAPTDTPPGGGLPCPSEAPTTPVATSTPGTPVAVSTDFEPVDCDESTLQASTLAMRKASASSAVEQKATEHAKALIDLAAQYPQLKRSDSDFSGGKLAAVNARILLKAAFKGVKFSVKSDYNSLRIEWQDGPTDGQVNAIVGRFDIGASDSMTDYFYTVSTAFSKLFGGVQYMTTKRNTSDALIQQAIDKLYAKREEKPTVQDYRKCAGVFDWNGQNYENRRMRETLESISYA